MSPTARYTRVLLKENNLPVGTSLENTVTWRLHRWGVLDQCQYRVGPYRLDYAWPAKLIALEADGPFHRQPDCAVKDAVRDAYLRAHGWLIFRIDDTSGVLDDLEDQLVRVVRMIRSEDDSWAAQMAAERRRAARHAAAAELEALARGEEIDA